MSRAQQQQQQEAPFDILGYLGVRTAETEAAPFRVRQGVWSGPVGPELRVMRPARPSPSPHNRRQQSQQQQTPQQIPPIRQMPAPAVEVFDEPTAAAQQQSDVVPASVLAATSTHAADARRELLAATGAHRRWLESRAMTDEERKARYRAELQQQMLETSERRVREREELRRPGETPRFGELEQLTPVSQRLFQRQTAPPDDPASPSVPGLRDTVKALLPVAEEQQQQQEQMRATAPVQPISELGATEPLTPASQKLFQRQTASLRPVATASAASVPPALKDNVGGLLLSDLEDDVGSSRR